LYLHQCNVADVKVEASIVVLKEAIIVLVKATPLNQLAGSARKITVGGIITAAAPVVKLQT